MFVCLMSLFLMYSKGVRFFVAVKNKHLHFLVPITSAPIIYLFIIIIYKKLMVLTVIVKKSKFC